MVSEIVAKMWGLFVQGEFVQPATSAAGLEGAAAVSASSRGNPGPTCSRGSPGPTCSQGHATSIMGRLAARCQGPLTTQQKASLPPHI